MDDEPRTSAGPRKDSAFGIDAKKLRAGATRRFFVGNERFDPPGFDVANANAPLPPGIPTIIRHAVGYVDVAFHIDRNRTRLAELRPAGDEVAFFVEHLDALIPAVRDVQPAFRIDLDAVRIVELQREATLRSDAATPRLDELTVLREAHEAVVATAGRVHVVFV